MLKQLVKGKLITTLLHDNSLGYEPVDYRLKLCKHLKYSKIYNKSQGPEYFRLFLANMWVFLCYDFLSYSETGHKSLVRYELRILSLCYESVLVC